MAVGDESWGYSTEQYPDSFIGACPTREAAIEEAPRELGLDPGDVFWLQKGWRPSGGHFLPDASDIVEIAGERASDEIGDPAEDYPEVDDAAMKELDALLEAWAEKHVKEPRFWIGEGDPERVVYAPVEQKSEAGR